MEALSSPVYRAQPFTKANFQSKVSRADFPDDFVFGAASSAYQVEGGAKEGGRGPSIWDTFTDRKPGNVIDGSNGNVAVNSFHLFKDDVKIIKRLGLDAYRFSISWSRILPGGRIGAGVNQAGIKYYNDLIDELIANDIQPFVTLFHWDVPQALEDEYHGFLSTNIVGDFAEFAELCFWEFGDRVKHWITLNEPWTFSNGGYALGNFAPGRGSSTGEHVEGTVAPSRGAHRKPRICSHGDPATEPYIVSHNLLLAHAAVVEIYRENFQQCQEGEIGVTLVTQWLEPLDENSDADKEAAKRGLDFALGWFLEPLVTGDYPQSMKKLVGSRLPRFSTEQSNKIKGSFDFLGINYYTGSYVTSSQPTNGSLSYSTDAQVTYSSERNGVLIGPPAGSSWLHIYPDGIYKLLLYLKNQYNVSEIYITENGVDEANNTRHTLSEARMDMTRIKYHEEHIYKVKQAISDGVNVKGYFIWSLMDNFEWAEGFTVRFGVIYVDFKDNYARYPKQSAIWFNKFFNRKNTAAPSVKRLAAAQDVPDKETTKKLRTK